MNTIAHLNVTPNLPKRLARLEDLAQNIYWSWNPNAIALFREISPNTFTASGHNPVRVLREAAQAELDAASNNKDFLKRMDAVIKQFDDYMGRKDTWYNTSKKQIGHVAYFSMEFGFHESFQIYSGGLGILAGDHCKSASDLGLPFTAVGLLYRIGYFHQQLNQDGWQEERFETINPSRMPLTLAQDQEGKPLKLQVEIADTKVTLQVWRMQVGRIEMLLLDSDCPENTPEDRQLTAQLYGTGLGWRSSHDLRVAQELILGVGGVRALQALNIPASVFHMNEGHAAFLGLERARQLVNSGQKFSEAVETIAASGIFTTHTPVPAGNDAFALEVIDRNLGAYWFGALGLSRTEFMELARHDQTWGQSYSMTVLALRCSRFANGVSELHGQVSRNMWAWMWPGALKNEVPIGHVTNGIHTRTFLSPELANLFDSHFDKGWDDRIEDARIWQAVDRISDTDLWDARMSHKRRLIAFVRERLGEQLRRAGGNLNFDPARVLNEQALTIGFARRFATYKRATLLFRDLARLKKIVNNPERPVQFVFAGKAHPADNPGKEFIQALYKAALDPEIAGKIVFLEDYDMDVARHMVQGADIWLNNPRRPLEASGTSGEKASLNGCLNFSVLDGWWREAYDGTNGWAIGDESGDARSNTDPAWLAVQDDRDARSLYDTLERDIAPLYYSDKSITDTTLPTTWLKWVRNAIRTVAPKFSMQRQVLDYTNKYYAAAFERGQKFAANNFALSKDVAIWKNSNRSHWDNLKLEASAESGANLQPGDLVKVNARVQLADLKREDLRVEAVLSRDGETQQSSPLKITGERDGWLEYAGEIALPESGNFDLGVRALPYRSELEYPIELSLLKWA